MAFSHLHVHSEYSLLDGLASVKDLIDGAQRLGMSALALTDHGNMFGVVDFYLAAIKRDKRGEIEFDNNWNPAFTVKPVIGCEVYLGAGTWFDMKAKISKTQNHLVLLIKNEIGYRNLSQIVSAAYLEGFYYKPRTDLDFLRGHSEGLIGLSACIAGLVPSKLLEGDFEGAKKIAMELNDIFSDGNFYLEIQDQGLEEERFIRSDLIRLSEVTGIPLVATNDIHYIQQEHAETHDVLLGVETNRDMHDPDRLRFSSDQFYMRTEEEMRELFSDIPEAIENTELIAKECNYHFDLKSIAEERENQQRRAGITMRAVETQGGFFPKFPVPEGTNNKELLRSLCEKGLDFRYGLKKEDYRDRLEYEMSVIEQMDFSDYFLIVWDFIRFARESGIPVGPGRGSAAGSIVSYALRITDIDPVRYGLLFERFLNPERKSMPDIDVDFCIERRGEVIDYVREKYGRDNVAQIITFGTLQARAAIDNIGRVTKVSLSDVTRLKKLLPVKARNFEEAYSGKSKDAEGKTVEFKEESERFIAAVEKDPECKYKKLMEYARFLEGKPRNPSTHAAGVVICREPLSSAIPLYMAKDSFDKNDKSVTVQYTMNTVENLGFLKMDFLGLRNLTLIKNTEKMVEQNRGIHVSVSDLPFDDPNVYKLIASGQTDGVFQLESNGMQGFMRQLQPKHFEDIIVGISMYRPGPMKDIPEYLKNRKAPKKIQYEHPLLKPILEPTYGVIVYQEQVMQIVRELAGQSYAESDEVRRIMSKKKADKMVEKRGEFIAGCANNGISEGTAKRIFEHMFSFASYAFNKSHAAVYAVLAYQTAYLKTYFREEFMAALMTSVTGVQDKVVRYIYNSRDMGIPVLPPDIMKAQKEFSVNGNAIVMGLKSVKNVGAAAIEGIIEARKQGLIHDMFSFVNHADSRAVNKKAVESLIWAGAFDSFSENRAKIMQDYILMSEKSKGGAAILQGQTSFFEQIGAQGFYQAEEIKSEVSDYPLEIRMEKEKEMLGMYFSAHPLDRVRGIVERVGAVSTWQIKHPEELEQKAAGGIIDRGRQIILVGLLKGLRHMVVQKGINAGKKMAAFALEDFFGEIECVVFADAFEKNEDVLALPDGSDASNNPDEAAEENKLVEENPGVPFPRYKIVAVRGTLMSEIDRTNSVRATKITPIEEIEAFFQKQDAEKQTEEKKGESDGQ